MDEVVAASAADALADLLKVLLELQEEGQELLERVAFVIGAGGLAGGA
jgi:hypothetical protein